MKKVVAKAKAPAKKAAKKVTKKTVLRKINYPSVKLAGTGDMMPQLGLGTWLSEEGQVY